MAWRPDKDIKKALKKLEDVVNTDILDNVFGIESTGDFLKRTAGGLDPTSAAVAGGKDRADAKVQRASTAADQAYADAKKAREAPFIIANQSLAARRRKLAESSLMSTGYSGKSAMLSSVAAVGKKSLGA